MKKHYLLILLLINAISNPTSAALPEINYPATYFVDKTNGNDDASGLSAEQAWSSLEKVNATTFIAGDRLLFKCGETWTGTLWPKGSGKSDLPIVIDKYGSGDLPVFDGDGLTDRGVLYFENQSGWEINNLEITNDAAMGGIRKGVEICGRNGGLLSHFYLKNLHVHHIKGMIGNEMIHKSTGGIFFAVYKDDVVPTRFDNILIENCEIHDCDNQGIVTLGNITYPDPASQKWNEKKFTNVVIRQNVIYNISKNAMILRLLDGGLVERNLCYATATGTTGNTIFTRSARKVVLQYNEGYDNQSPDYDGCMYDADLESVDCIFQYSYSHDNAHGLYWQCTVQEDYGNIVRYNISQNDKGRIFNFSYPSNGTAIYNNTVFIGAHRSPVIIGEKNLKGGKRNYSFKNNLVYNLSTSASYIWVGEEYIGKREFSNNLFYGHHPAGEPLDLHKVTADPLLSDPGTGGEGLDNLEGYQLMAGSPAIDNGAPILNNGGRDFFGNPVTGTPDIGAFEFQGIVGLHTLEKNEGRSAFNYCPEKNEIRLTPGSESGRWMSIEIVNLQGKVLSSKGEYELSDEGPCKNIALPEKLRSGIYFVSILNEKNTVESHPFVVL